MTESLADKIRAANATLLVEGDHAAIAEYFSPDYVVHLTARDLKGGHETIGKIVDMLRRAFSDLQVDVEVLVEGQDRVAWQRTIHGTHSGSYQGFPATGKRTVWRDAMTSEFQDGRIAREWFVSDLAEQLLRARKG